ncbi:uncharacterized protein F4812DRAFT_201051 [Daldinia caldariorum]|uniref:uncharacterized protein n=1 Tax=Daldinia caldariorum TaxID=326644 RepID=UPI002008A6B6|nr:uncharacterized protein F4812DRAFT_201051 [Daldinia caldariorum]KAI1471977.1 hypothetical protein F4812DRAFT_201051 [Daldinia caldariorum]
MGVGRAVLWGCKYRAHIYVILFFFLLLPFFIVIVLRSRDERIPVHFFRIIPPGQRFLPIWGQVHHSLGVSLSLGAILRGGWNLRHVYARARVCVYKEIIFGRTKRRRRRNGYTRQLVPPNGCVAFYLFLVFVCEDERKKNTPSFF